ncbi:hypothetical protein N9277_01110, partial [bacterium]|nr:hypothetical protein [bacterium]
MKLALKIIVPLLIIVAAVLAFKALKASAPEPPSKKPIVVIPRAQFINVSPADHTPPVRTFGTVSSFFETTLTAQISGRVIEVSPDFRVGRSVSKGAVLVRIDPTDFDAEIVSRRAAVSLAKRALAEEEIRAEQAAEDWKISGRDLDTAPDYVLRKPQLAAARGDVQAAEAAVEKASAD